MLDIRFVRSNPSLLEAELKRRNQPELRGLVRALLGKDRKLIRTAYRAEQLKKKRNRLTAEIKALMATKKPAAKKQKEAKVLSQKIAKLDSEAAGLRGECNSILLRLPNILDKSVPEGEGGQGNKVIRRWGKTPVPSFSTLPHGEFLQAAGLADFERGAKISGAGFFFLRGDLVLLDNALMQYALEALLRKGFTPIAPPLIMNRKPYAGVAPIGDFETVMYKIDGEESYLIATSEHPICAMHAGEIFEEHDLPLKYAGISPCFRREIGAHGVDTRGLFRVHQFNKAEQFVFCRPEESKKWHELLIENAEELMQGLRIPYRVVNVCTGDIGTVAAKKYDLEAWFPREQCYKETASCSNCTSYQAVRSNIKYRKGKDSKEFVHTLNSTAIATSRVIRAVVENFQTEEGNIAVPEPLQRYMGNLEEIKPARPKK